MGSQGGDGGGGRAREFISNQKDRKSTFQRRKQCLIKKARELSILCGIDTCVVVNYYDTSLSSAEICYSQDRDEVWRIAHRYQQHLVDDESQNNNKKKRKRDTCTCLEGQKKAKIVDTSDGNLVDDLSGDQLRSLKELLGDRIRAAKQRLPPVKLQKENMKAGAFADAVSTMRRRHCFNVGDHHLREESRPPPPPSAAQLVSSNNPFVDFFQHHPQHYNSYNPSMPEFHGSISTNHSLDVIGYPIVQGTTTADPYNKDNFYNVVWGYPLPLLNSARPR